MVKLEKIERKKKRKLLTLKADQKAELPEQYNIPFWCPSSVSTVTCLSILKGWPWCWWPTRTPRERIERTLSDYFRQCAFPAAGSDALPSEYKCDISHNAFGPPPWTFGIGRRIGSYGCLGGPEWFRGWWRQTIHSKCSRSTTLPVVLCSMHDSRPLSLLILVTMVGSAHQLVTLATVSKDLSSMMGTSWTESKQWLAL